MGPPLDDYTLKMRNLHQRYGLSESALELFKAYGEHHRGVQPPDALGRLLRTSTLMRACTDTITSLTTAMQKNSTPECIAECSEIITCCTDMLNIANESNRSTRLPFMKFPAEIRRNVYQYYFDDLLLPSPYWSTADIIRKSNFDCICATHKSKTMKLARPLDISLICTCSHIKDEALEEWFRRHHFSFACGCELRHCLRINKAMNYNLRSVEVHWTGRESHSAFKLLQKIPTLKNLVVVVSKSTTNLLSKKEVTLRRYLPSRYHPGITEALGFRSLEELVRLRGLVDVKVVHVDRKQAFRCSEQERNGLQEYLKHVAERGTLED